MSFFGAEITAGKPTVQEVEMPFRITMAALGATLKSQKRVSLVVKTDDIEKEMVVCSLTPGKLEQQALDLAFFPGENVEFKVVGDSSIFLTGNFADEDEMMDMAPSDYEEDGEEDEVSGDDEEDVSGGSEEEEDEEEDEDFEDVEDESDIDSQNDEEMEQAFMKMIQERVAAGESVEDIEAELEAMAEEDSDDESGEEEEEEARIEELKEEEQQTAEETKKNNNNKKRENSAISKEDAAASSSKEADGAPKKARIEEPKKVVNADAKKSVDGGEEKTKTLPNGLKITEIKAGTGARAKNGREVGIQYVGKLTDSGKEFDRSKGNKPFKFNLGKGECIKGFDMGVQGMQVGGERRIVIPSELGYGKKGMPGIPANSKLTFDIKLVYAK